MSAGTLQGCGTLIYPERDGQARGELDASIVLLNGLGTLLFFVPGVIAFAVDFSTGAIYLPGGKQASLTPEALANPVERLNAIEQAVLQHTGKQIVLDSNTQVVSIQ